MLNLNCVICAELFAQSDDVHATPCGHMFHLLCLKKWMERSKSCPQCRNRCTERNIFRIYFNLANLDVSGIDVGSLQEQLDNAKLQITIKEKELAKCAEQVKTFKDSQKKCMKTIATLEQTLQQNSFIMLSYNEQLKQLKSDVKLMNELRKENKQLKQTIETLEGVSSMINGTAAEVDKLLKNENDPKKLSILVTILRRELRTCESKKTDLRNVLKVVQSDFRKEIEVKKSREDRIVELESENYELAEKLKKLEESISKAHSELIKPPNFMVETLKADERRKTISPTVKENVKKIEESSSPYLNIKSSSVGLLPLFKRNLELTNTDANTRQTTTKLKTIKISPVKSNTAKNSAPCTGAVRKISSDLTEKYSIFKKPRLGMIAASASAGTAAFRQPIGSKYVSNGFGGSERDDPFARNSEDEAEMESQDVDQCRQKISSSNVPKNMSNRLKAGGFRNFQLKK